MSKFRILLVVAATICAAAASAGEYCRPSEKGAPMCQGEYQYRCICSGSYDKPYCAWMATGAKCEREGAK
jgi:hypothetical protein